MRTNADRMPEISETDRLLWRDSIERECGLYFNHTRTRYMCRGLWDRMRELSMTNYGDYFRYFENPTHRSREWPALLEHLINKESSFFRHQPSYEALKDFILPEVINRYQQKGNHQRLSLWSAGCSIGQETYSLAMTLLELVDPSTWQLEVLGTDLSEQSIKIAREGRYKPFETGTLPHPFARKYLKRSHFNGSLLFEVNPRVRSLFDFPAAICWTTKLSSPTVRTSFSVRTC